jgi:hypothetical protein
MNWTPAETFGLVALIVLGLILLRAIGGRLVGIQNRLAVLSSAQRFNMPVDTRRSCGSLGFNWALARASTPLHLFDEFLRFFETNEGKNVTVEYHWVEGQIRSPAGAASRSGPPPV